MRKLSVLTAGLCLAFTACAPKAPAPQGGNVTISKKAFGQTPAGQPVEMYTLASGSGFEAAIITFGGIVVSLKTPDRKGQFADVVLGFDSLDGYLQAHPYFGAIIGRYGNRIAKAQFKLNGQTYKLAANNGANSLHGGLKGFDKVLWQAREAQVEGAPALELTYVSKDGAEGYPGTLTTKVTYSVSARNELRIDYEAATGQDTVVNLTNHSYFNLAGQGEGDILQHKVQLMAAKFTPVDGGLIPTGELRAVAGTPFDFGKPEVIGARINQDDEQLKLGKGYDHNFVLDAGSGALAVAARVSEATTGRVMEVLTTEPAIQFYTGNFLDGAFTGKGGKVYRHRYGFCLETQHYPDSPNQPAFPSTLLKPGATYRTTTVYRFSAE